MSFKVKGFNHKTGTFEGHDYNNYQLFGHDDNMKWDVVKLKASVLDDAGVYDVNILIDNKIDVFYDRYGKVSGIKIA